jgi:preprotein translocase subunit SecD
MGSARPAYWLILDRIAGGGASPASLVDGKVIAAPAVRAKLGEKVLITGKYTKEQAEKLATSIRGK